MGTHLSGQTASQWLSHVPPPCLAALEAVRSRLSSGCFAALNVSSVLFLSRNGRRDLAWQLAALATSRICGENLKGAGC